jgi:hypothetical protein
VELDDLRGGDAVTGHYSGSTRNALLIVRATVGLGLVLAQLVFVLIVHLSGCCKERYFAWAPNDYSVDYQISASVNGRPLSDSEISDRYRLDQADFWEDPPERLEGLLKRRELAYAGPDRVTILLEYRLNGRPTAKWTWSDG